MSQTSNFCMYCKKLFSDKYTRIRHEINCPYTEMKLEQDGQFQSLSQQFKALKSENENLVIENAKLRTKTAKIKEKYWGLQESHKSMEKEHCEASIRLRILEGSTYSFNKSNAERPLNQRQRGGDRYKEKSESKLRTFDITVETIQEAADEFYTHELFLKGQKGVSEFVHRFLLPDTDGKYPYICTSREGLTFRYKDEYGQVQKDELGVKFTQIVWDGIKAKLQQITKQLQDVAHQYDLHQASKQKANERRQVKERKENKKKNTIGNSLLDSDLDETSEYSESESPSEESDNEEIISFDNDEEYDTLLNLLLKKFSSCSPDELIEKVTSVRTHINCLNPESRETNNRKKFLSMISKSVLCK